MTIHGRRPELSEGGRRREEAWGGCRAEERPGCAEEGPSRFHARPRVPGQCGTGGMREPLNTGTEVRTSVPPPGSSAQPGGTLLAVTRAEVGDWGWSSPYRSQKHPRSLPGQIHLVRRAGQGVRPSFYHYLGTTWVVFQGDLGSSPGSAA